MGTAEGLYNRIKAKRSFLCIGLDPDMDRIPGLLKKDRSPLFRFNREIVDATHEFAIAYKPNLAFYESQGTSGWTALEKTVSHIRSSHPDILLIADAKRGDIGNTAGMYARTFFGELDFDAVTVTPYMGRDSVLPFLEYEDKWVILLGLTSNSGAEDFQLLETGKHGTRLFEEVIRRGAEWGDPDRIMFVAGATRPDFISDIRRLVPDHFLLIPGVGAQGGSLEEVVRQGLNDRCGLIVNASRSILYADSSGAFASAARKEAESLAGRMAGFLA